MRDDSGHLKVADFGVSKLLKVTNRVKEDTPLSCQDTSCEFAALTTTMIYAPISQNYLNLDKEFNPPHPGQQN